MDRYDIRQIPDDHPVRSLLRKRGSGGKLGLVVEGGGMRGVVTAGAALALEQLGLRDAFRSFYGVSAGAVVGAYFAAGRATWGTSVFYDDLLREEFFSWRRMLRGEPPLDLDFVIDKVVSHSKKLDTDEVLRKDLHIFASRFPGEELVSWNSFSGQEDLLGALRASMSLPFFAGGPYSYRGEEYFDAGIHTSIPWREALDDGCTHLLVLLSRPRSSPRPPIPLLERFLTRNVFARQYPELVPTLLQRVESYNEDLRQLRNAARQGAPILLVSPPPGFGAVASFERRREPLLEGARQGAEATYRALFGSSPHFYELLIASELDGRPIHSSRNRRWRFF